MAISTYWDFAENDYNFFQQSFRSGNKGNPLAYIGQSICERYLKHIIEEYAEPVSPEEDAAKQSVLRTHSINKLLKYLNEQMEIPISDELTRDLLCVDGYYFSTRYPGSESFMASDRDILLAKKAIESARAFVSEYIYERAVYAEKMDKLEKMCKEHGWNEDSLEYELRLSDIQKELPMLFDNPNGPSTDDGPNTDDGPKNSTNIER